MFLALVKLLMDLLNLHLKNIAFTFTVPIWVAIPPLSTW